MSHLFIGKKIGMTQFLHETGSCEPVTVVGLTPLTVIHVKSVERDGYSAYVLAYGSRRLKHSSKPLSGIFRKSNIPPSEGLTELKFTSESSYKVGDILPTDSLKVGTLVTVRGVSIGKGTAGTIKRHNFRRGPVSHGSKNIRLPGSIGGGTEPGRVFKGTRMAGHYGNANVTIKNLAIVHIDSEKRLLYIKGSVPGKKNNLLRITSTS